MALKCSLPWPFNFSANDSSFSFGSTILGFDDEEEVEDSVVVLLLLPAVGASLRSRYFSITFKYRSLYISEPGTELLKKPFVFTFSKNFKKFGSAIN